MPHTVSMQHVANNYFQHFQMKDFAIKTFGSVISMPISFTKTSSSKGSFSEARPSWHYEIFDGGDAMAVMQAPSHFLHANIIAAGKNYQINPVINYFTLNKYLVLENDLDVGEIIIPSLLHKKISIEIYGQGVWQIKRSQARYKSSATKLGHYELVPPLETGFPNPLLSALFLFLSELLAWENNRL